ncbi:hypothetical protein K7X08_036745 [Anisodus acutangulus]|uniref:Uncharacterized protein n=1 Tax=Anisodus acutangulus TaxID=402998 RepID=A0A9Q1L7R4_9SOLA|nr:hypothetical protein K7X08_036745 [Anisodus acutangulus]
MLKPSTPTPNHLRSLKLSLFDQVAPRLYVPVLFHYLPNSEWNSELITERCDKLQKSLAETLTKFYPLAGRFREDELSVHCNDEGVEYVETKVNADLAEFLHQGPKSELLNDLLPTYKPSSPLLLVQVNIFNCGGLVMGINISHILADGFTLGTFVKEWTRISQTGTTEEHALGNFCLAGIATLEANQSRKELTDFVNMVGSTARDTSVGIAKASVDDITSMFVNFKIPCQKEEMDMYFCTSWCKFPWYEADFGWGKPFWVSDVSKPAELITLIDTKSGDGIEAWIGLKENEMAEFQRDPDILTFCPPQN